MAKRFVLWAIGWYQKAFSGRPSPCRFVPSCSSYASEAVEVHGALKGTCMGAWRICRCNPWGGHGLDPVPPNKAALHNSPRNSFRNEEQESCLT